MGPSFGPNPFLVFFQQSLHLQFGFLPSCVSQLPSGQLLFRDEERAVRVFEEHRVLRLFTIDGDAGHPHPYTRLVYREDMNRRTYLRRFLALLAIPLTGLLSKITKAEQPARVSTASIARLADFFVEAEKREEKILAVYVDEADYMKLCQDGTRDIRDGVIWGASLKRALAPDQNGNVHLLSDKAHYLVHWDRAKGSRFLLTGEREFTSTTFSTLV